MRTSEVFQRNSSVKQFRTNIRGKQTLFICRVGCGSRDKSEFQIRFSSSSHQQISGTQLGKTRQGVKAEMGRLSRA